MMDACSSLWHSAEDFMLAFLCYRSWIQIRILMVNNDLGCFRSCAFVPRIILLLKRSHSLTRVTYLEESIVNRVNRDFRALSVV